MADGVAERIDARRESAITVNVDGRAVSASAGETVAAVLLAEGIRVLRYTTKRGEPRGVYEMRKFLGGYLKEVSGIRGLRNRIMQESTRQGVRDRIADFLRWAAGEAPTWENEAPACEA